MTGSVRAEKSLIPPTGDCFSSVVRRNNGNNANLMSGTDSSPPTRREPIPSSPPRNDLRLSVDNPDGEELPAEFCERSAPSDMQFLTDHDLVRLGNHACS